MQKFVPRSRVGLFSNEHTRSTPCDPKLTFWCVRTIWVHSGLFGCLTKLDAKQADKVQKFVPRSRVGIFHNKSTQSTPLYPKLMFWGVSYYLGAFGTIWLAYETRCKTGCNECIRSTPLDPKLTLWCISYHLGAFGTFCLPYQIGAKQAELVQKFVP